MSDLAHWEAKIQEKRKHTPFREFIKEIASWFPIAFYRYEDGLIWKFPKERIRVLHPVSSRIFAEERDSLASYGLPVWYDIFSAMSKLFSTMPIEALKQFEGTINTDYADIALGKNIYLTVVGFESENVAYGFNVKDNCRNVYNSVLVWENCENIYFGRYVTESLNVFYSQYIHASNNIWLSSDLIGCSECIACSWLRNMSHCINNVSYPKDEYNAKKREYLDNKHRFDVLYEQIIRRASRPEITNYQCGEIENGYMNYRVNEGRNVMFVGGESTADKMYDVISAGILTTTDFYGVMGAGIGSEYIYCSVEVTGSSHIFYSYLLESCSFCIGCIGLKNKSYCILNKQYTKEEWYELTDKIFASMESDGTLGKFFPGSMNPFYFNDTLAALVYDDFTKEEVTKDGYLWRDEAIRADIPEWAEIIESSDLDRFQWYDAEWNWRIDPEIKKRVIRDTQGNCYRIVPMEYDFLMKHALPLPTIHWLDRIKMGFRV